MWRTLIGYPAGAFAVLQAVDFFIARYGWSPKLLNTTLALLLCGFPIALMWNWYHGEPGKQEMIRLEKISYPLLILIAIVSSWITWNRSDATSYMSVSPLPVEIKDKRLAILVFENLTQDPDIDVFGIMISDWLTKGLKETGEANVINSANIQTQIEESNLSGAANPQFASMTGVSWIITGRYYLMDTRLFVVADFVDVTTGNTIHSLQLDKPREESMALLHDLTQEILGYWEVKENIRYRLNPPNYEAYKEWLQGTRIALESAERAAVHMENAFRLDSNFYEALFQLSRLHITMSNAEKAQSIMEFLEPRKTSFTKFEQLDFESLQASIERDYLKGAWANDKKVEMDPSDYASNYRAASYYYNANLPKRTIETLRGYDHRLIHRDNVAIGWRAALEAAAHYKVGNYQEVLKLEENYPFPKMSVILAAMNLQSLIKMDSLDRLDRTFTKYLNEGIYGPTGIEDLPDHRLVLICNELLNTGKEDYLKKYANELETWLAQNEVARYDHKIPDVFNNRPFRKKEVEGYIDFYRRNYEGARQFWASENIPKSNWPDLIERHSRLGVCFALEGSEEQARKHISMIDAMDPVPNPYFESNKAYYKARIYAALGEKDKAVQEIHRSFNEGLVLLRPHILKNDPFLKSLHGFPPFEEVVNRRI